MKACRIILIAIVAFGLVSCHSKRQLSSEEYIYDEMMANAELMKKKDKKKEEKRSDKSFTKVLLDEAYSWNGVPYKYGGHSKKGTDCSGFIMEVFRNAIGIELPRSSIQQSDICTRIDKKDLQIGDLVFFHPGKKGKISHVGLYIGDNKMIHASSHGVMVSGLNEAYYSKHYHHSGRLDAVAALRKKEKK